MHLKSLACLGLTALALFGAPIGAKACSPEMHVPGETPEAKAARESGYERDRQVALSRRQDELWNRADHVFLARVVETRDPEWEAEQLRREMQWQRALARTRAAGRPSPPPPRVAPPVLGGRKMVVVLEPVASLKGALPPQRVEITGDQPDYAATCGRRSQFDVFYGHKDDELFLIFVEGPYLTQDGLLEAMSSDRVVAQRVRAALDATGVTAPQASR